MKKQLAAIALALTMAAVPIVPVETVAAQEITASMTEPGKPTIKSAASTKANTAKITLSEKVSGASGYQVMYATNAKFTSAKTKKFTGTSVTISSLSKKTYYFRVRAYKKSGNEVVYGKWSGVKKVAVKGASTITYKASKFTLQLPASWKGCYVADEFTFDGLQYVALFPTDVQFIGASQKAQTNYGKMTQQVGKVLATFKLLQTK